MTFVGEGVLRDVCVERAVDPGALELLFQGFGCSDGEELVFGREVSLHRNRDLRRINIVDRGKSVPRHRRIDLPHEDRGQEGQRTAHAIANDTDLTAIGLEVHHGAADVLDRKSTRLNSSHT